MPVIFPKLTATAFPDDARRPREVTTAVVEAAARNGLLLLKSGIYTNCIRVLIPFVISGGKLDEGLDVWESALEATLS